MELETGNPFFFNRAIDTVSNVCYYLHVQNTVANLRKPRKTSFQFVENPSFLVQRRITIDYFDLQSAKHKFKLGKMLKFEIFKSKSQSRKKNKYVAILHLCINCWFLRRAGFRCALYKQRTTPVAQAVTIFLVDYNIELDVDFPMKFQVVRFPFPVVNRWP